jgi:uncharacterized protein YwqG
MLWSKIRRLGTSLFAGGTPPGDPKSLDPSIQDRYSIIRLHSSGHYYGTAAQAADMPLGQSRIGGPIIDLPEGFEHPPDLFFVAQFDLAWLAPCTLTESLLPAGQGFLYFFYNMLIADHRRQEVGQVHYFPGAAQQLRRTIREHDDWFSEGTTLADWSEEEELLEERFQADGEWDSWNGMDKTKIGGYPSNPQWYEEDVARALAANNRQLLLQVGEDITAEGCLCCFIDTADLRHKRFDRCEFVWGQS